jgi:hypothetical protein
VVLPGHISSAKSSCNDIAWTTAYPQIVAMQHQVWAASALPALPSVHVRGRCCHNMIMWM